MLAQSLWAPESASTISDRVDALYWFLNGLTLFFTVLIAFLVIYFAVKYRRRSPLEVPKPVEGSLRLETLWAAIPLAIVMFIFVWGASLFYDMRRPPDDAQEIYVVAKQWMWKLQHPGGQREINELHVPLGRPVKLIMTSEDVIHSFFVPAFRVKQDVLPGRVTTLWFEATRPGRFHLFCAEYCGTGHSQMIGWVVVLPPAEYEDWLRSRAEGSLALEGRKLFTKLRCISCHNNEQPRAPSLEAVFNKQVLLDTGRTVPADESYLRESILEPRAKVVAGYQPIMPTYKGQVNPEEMFQLIEFIKTLRLGETPPRVEETAPPIEETAKPQAEGKKREESK